MAQRIKNHLVEEYKAAQDYVRCTCGHECTAKEYHGHVTNSGQRPHTGVNFDFLDSIKYARTEYYNQSGTPYRDIRLDNESRI